MKYIWSKVIHIVDTCVKTHVKSKLLSSGLGSVSSEVFAGFPYLCLCHRSVSCPCGAVGGCNSSANSPLWSGWFKIKGKKLKSAGKTAKEWLEWKKMNCLNHFYLKSFFYRTSFSFASRSRTHSSCSLPVIKRQKWTVSVWEFIPHFSRKYTLFQV